MAVNLTAPTVLRLDRPRRRSRRRGHAVTPCASTVDAQRCCGSEDTALYACGCGFAFTAEVTTTVGCPHCGTQQAW